MMNDVNSPAATYILTYILVISATTNIQPLPSSPTTTKLNLMNNNNNNTDPHLPETTLIPTSLTYPSQAPTYAL